MKLADVISCIEEVAPPHLAEDWDNTGLLIEPRSRLSVSRVLLTIDLTAAVLQEAKRKKAQLIVAYHPPIFEPVTHLTRSDAKSRLLLDVLAAGIAVYSPHTALDTVPGGLNDWLADGIGAGIRVRIVPSQVEVATSNHLTGQGRLIKLDKAVSFATLLGRVKKHLGLKHVKVARCSNTKTVRSIALCAGAGGSVLNGVPADVYLTGEMRHHDVLDANTRGVSVILCDHTNTERGYLPVFKVQIQRLLDKKVSISISQADREPLTTV